MARNLESCAKKSFTYSSYRKWDICIAKRKVFAVWIFLIPLNSIPNMYDIIYAGIHKLPNSLVFDKWSVL